MGRRDKVEKEGKGGVRDEGHQRTGIPGTKGETPAHTLAGRNTYELASQHYPSKMCLSAILLDLEHC